MRFALVLSVLSLSSIAMADATINIAVDPLVRVVRPDTQHPGSNGVPQNIVAEIQGGECKMGGEQGGRKFGVWLRMPRAACPNDLAGFGDVPHVLDATDEIVFDSNGAATPKAIDHIAQLATPIHWTAPKDGIVLARRFMAKQLAAHPELANDKTAIAARNTLAIHDDEGKITTDRAVLLALCAKTNDLACERAATGAKTKDEKRALLGRACQLENGNACYALGVDLRNDALEAMKRSKEIQAFNDFQCGIGKKSSVTPVAYEAITCTDKSQSMATSRTVSDGSSGIR